MTAPTPTGAEAADAIPAEAPRSSLGRNLLLLVVLLVAVAAFTDLWTPWTSDDGSYAVQTRLVRDEGTWHLPETPAWADPDAGPPMINGTVTSEGVYPYVRQPAWILALVASSSVVSEPYGLYLVQVAAAVAAAATAWAITRRLHPPAADLAFWVVAGAPLVVWAFGLWAHAPVAAAGGGIALGLVRLAGRRSSSGVGAAVLIGVSAAVATGLRTEGLVVAAAAACAAAWIGWTDGGRHRALRASVPAAVILAFGFGARIATSWWAGRIAVGASAQGAEGLSGSGGGIAGRVDGALATLAVTRATSTSSFVLGIAALAIAVAAGRRVAVARRVDRMALVLAAGWLVLVVVRNRSFPLDHLSGLLVAAPFVTVGLSCVRWSGLGRREKALAVYVAVFVAGVLATQYSAGGGHEWGGRFLSGGLVAMAVLASIAFTRRVPTTGAGADGSAVPADRGDRRRMAFLGLVVLVPAIVGVVVTGQTRDRRSAGADAVERAGAPIVVSLDPVGAHLAWRTLPETQWVRATPEYLVPTLERAIAAGDREFTVYAAEADAVAELGCDVEAIERAVLRVTC